MIGDKDLNILRGPVLDLLAARSSPQSRRQHRITPPTSSKKRPTSKTTTCHFFSAEFPALDVIDIDYGPHTAASPDGYHHTADDTIDKISPHSLQIAADLFLELIRLINA